MWMVPEGLYSCDLLGGITARATGTDAFTLGCPSTCPSRISKIRRWGMEGVHHRDDNLLWRQIRTLRQTPFHKL